MNCKFYSASKNGANVANTRAIESSCPGLTDEDRVRLPRVADRQTTPPVGLRIAIIAASLEMLRQQAVYQASALCGAALCSSLERGAIATLLRRGHASQAAPAPVEAPTLPPFDYTPPPYTGPPKDEVLALRKKYLNPGKQQVVGSECRGPAGSRSVQSTVG